MSFYLININDKSEIQMSSNSNKEKLLTVSQSDKEDNQNNTKPIEHNNINNHSFLLIYLYMICISITTNLEDGVIASSLFKIKEDFYFKEVKLGLIDTITVLGKIMSGIVIISIVNTTNNKFFFVTSLFLKIFSLFSSAFFSSSVIFYIGRFISGASQAFFIIYFPIWIDNYYKGFTAQKPLLITFLQFSTPISIMIGFGLSSIFFLKVYSFLMF